MNKEMLIRVLYPTVPTRALCDYLGMSNSQIYNRVFAMGVKKNERIKKKQNQKLIMNAGPGTRFQPGRVPHNKGKQMSQQMYEKCAPTMFKPGVLPPNTREPNAISIRTDKSGKAYSYTKIRDGYWKLTHRVLWENVHGPIPQGHVVRFKDGNPLNINILNLECLPMRKNMLRNTIQRFPIELQTVIRLKSKLNKKIKQNGKKRNE